MSQMVMNWPIGSTTGLTTNEIRMVHEADLEVGHMDPSALVSATSLEHAQMFDMGMNDQRQQTHIASTHDILLTALTGHSNTDEIMIPPPTSRERRGCGRSTGSARKQSRAADLKVECSPIKGICLPGQVHQIH